MSTAAEPVPWGSPGSPPRAPVTDMARSLDFYLALGCEVRRAADGWVLLRCGSVSFELVGPAAGTGSPVAGRQWLRLTTPDVRSLRRRLLAGGVRAGTLRRPADTPAGQIVVADPDHRLVAIGQPGPRRPSRETPVAACGVPVPTDRVDSGREQCATRDHGASIRGPVPSMRSPQTSAHDRVVSRRGSM